MPQQGCSIIRFQCSHHSQIVAVYVMVARSLEALQLGKGNAAQFTQAKVAVWILQQLLTAGTVMNQRLIVTMDTGATYPFRL